MADRESRRLRQQLASPPRAQSVTAAAGKLHSHQSWRHGDARPGGIVHAVGYAKMLHDRIA